MNLIEAVESAVFKKYASFKGRAPRSEFWYFILFQAILTFFVLVVVGMASLSLIDEAWVKDFMAYVKADGKNNTNFAMKFAIQSEFGQRAVLANFLVNLLLFVPSFSVTVRRLQDLDISYYWAFPALIMSIVGLYYDYFPLEAFESFAKRLGGLFALIVIVYFLVFIRRGTRADNRFGDDPLEIEDFEDTY